MKKTVFGILIGVGLASLVSFTLINYEPKKSTAEVEQMQGVYIFAKSNPIMEYERLGTIKGSLIGSHEFDKMIESIIKKAKKEYPNVDALLFDGVIRQTHNTRVSVIKFK